MTRAGSGAGASMWALTAATRARTWPPSPPPPRPARERCAAAPCGPGQKHGPIYLLDVQQDLFGQWWFVREFGRIGAAGTIKLDLFSTEAEAQSRGTEAPREGAARLCSITTP